MNCCATEGCPEEKKYSEHCNAIRKNVEDFLWKVIDLDDCDKQDTYTLALFKKLGSASTIEDLANMTIDMSAALQKIKLKEETKEDEMEEKSNDSVFIELFKINDPKNSEMD